MKAIRLRTEYLNNPIGIDMVKPRLFWNCEGGVKQRAYQVQAVDGEGNLLWDSGKTESPSMRVPWGGETLKSRAEVSWKVRLWDETDTEGEWSAPAAFELGLLKEEDWQAQWITGDYKVNKKERYPADCFRKVFLLPETEEKVKARLYITACGLYEAKLNGKRVGDFVLAPGVTDYKRRIQYQTYDVGILLKSGENVLEVQLADGWYRGSVGAWGLLNQYGTETKVLAQMEITRYKGGEPVRCICSGDDWEWSNDGSIRFADNKDGEDYDARRVPSYEGKAKLTHYAVVPTASDNVALTEHETFSAKRIETPSGATVLDFGQNIAGYVSFSVKAKEGQKIFLRFGEMLDENGEFTQKNIQCSNKKKTTPLQQVKYICKEGRNEYKTTFAIFGFQYVLVKTEAEVRAEDFTAIAVYSAMEETVKFASSHPLLDKFVENTRWSAKGNMADLLTDCPTRERHGWTGDAQIFCGTASYLFDYMAFGRKFIRDMYDWQREDGCLPQIVPEGGVDPYMNPMNGSVGWADAGVIMPYRLWKQYGDRGILEEYYDCMVKYARFMERRCGKWYPTAKRVGLKGEEKRYLVNCGQAYGEWAEPADVRANTWKDAVITHPETATAYTCYVMEMMQEIAKELGKTADAEEFARFAKGNRKSYQALRRTVHYPLDTDRQAQLVRPLYFKMLDGEQTEYAKERLLAALEHYGWRLGTGFLSTPLILDVLAEIDMKYAYRLLENEEMPGWLFMPKNGATTVWESWEGTRAQGGIASLNHYSKGAVCEWLFRVMCGIEPDGENHFRIAPRPGGTFTHAECEYKSIYGAVSCGWKKQEDQTYVYTVRIPANCEAEIVLPDGTKTVQKSGVKEYRA